MGCTVNVLLNLICLGNELLNPKALRFFFKQYFTAYKYILKPMQAYSEIRKDRENRTTHTELLTDLHENAENKIFWKT